MKEILAEKYERKYLLSSVAQFLNVLHSCVDSMSIWQLHSALPWLLARAPTTEQKTAKRSNLSNPDGNQGIHDHTIATATTKWLNLKSVNTHLKFNHSVVGRPAHA